MCWDATPCDGDGRLGFEISPTTSPSTPLCASGDRYFSYQNISQGDLKKKKNLAGSEGEPGFLASLFETVAVPPRCKVQAIPTSGDSEVMLVFGISNRCFLLHGRGCN